MHTAATVATQREPHLLSSSTELRDSIHSGSTSPSQMIQERCCRGSLATALDAAVRMPSDHSRVSASMCPAEHTCFWGPSCCCQDAIRPGVMRSVPQVTSHVICIAAMPFRHWLLPSSCQKDSSCRLKDSTAFWHCLVHKGGKPVPVNLHPCARQDRQCSVGALSKTSMSSSNKLASVEHQKVAKVLMRQSQAYICRAVAPSPAGLRLGC